MQVRPQDSSADPLGRVQEVMMIVPIDAKVNEAEDVAEKHGQQRLQGGERRAVRHFQFQHHDGDDNRQHAIAERFESAFGHGRMITIVAVGREQETKGTINLLGTPQSRASLPSESPDKKFSMTNRVLFLLVVTASVCSAVPLTIVTNVEPQPFTAQVKRLIEATDYLGVPF